MPLGEDAVTSTNKNLRFSGTQKDLCCRVLCRYCQDINDAYQLLSPKIKWEEDNIKMNLMEEDYENGS